MKQIKILVSFKDNEMIFPNIEFVKNDYNHVEFIFDFDEDDGKKVFELKKPNGKVFIKEIIDNKVLLSDFDEKGNIIPVINQSGLYEFEITKYKSDSKFTISKVCQFMARDEIVNIDDDIVDKDASLPILNDLITTTIALKENTEKIGQLVKEKGDHAEEQGNYAKEAASNVINANNQATKLINNFESNVNEYTSDFNKKATTKQEKFDSNSTTKINEYNDNATSKLKQYNDNHESKLKDYNDNASEKTKAFNSNSLLKTTAYDKNADDKLSAYNTNGATKLDEYNDNATLKTEEYNTNASSKIEEYNSNATQKLEEYDEHSEELNNKINSTNSELEKLKDEILETGEVSDSFIHVKDSKKNELLKLEVDGVCEQVTTTGKNRFDVSKLPMTLGGVTLSVDKNGNVVLNGTPTITSDYINFIVSQEIEFEPDTYTMSVENKKTGIGTAITGFEGKLNLILSETRNSKTYTSTEKYTSTLQINVRYDVGTLNNFILNPQLEVGETKTKYEMFTGNQFSPSPDYPQEIKTIENSLKITSCNKNLMDPNKVITGYYINIHDGTLVKSNTDSYVEYTLIKPNETYWKQSTNYFFLYDKDKKNIKSGHGKKILTTPDSMYIRWTLSSSDLRLEQYLIQSEVEPTSFEQHLETQITANLPEGEFIGKINDTYKDTLKVEYNEEDGNYHLNLYKSVRKVVLDGSENWTLSTYTNEIILSLYTNNYNIKRGNLISDKFIYRDSVDSTIITEYCSSGTNVIRIGILKTTCGTIEEFKTWLSTHNTEVYYTLAEPYVVDLGIVDMPITYNETTNLFTDSDLMPTINAKYYKNFISTIRNLQINNNTLKNELASIENRLATLESASSSAVSDEPIEESEVTSNE